MVLNSSFDQVKDFDQILLVIGVCVAVNLKKLTKFSETAPHGTMTRLQLMVPLQSHDVRKNLAGYRMHFKVPKYPKTLPKAQRTRRLSSSFQSNFLKSYYKFKHKS